MTNEERLLTRMKDLITELVSNSSTGSSTWGSITGTITNQTDLVNYTNGLFNSRLFADDTTVNPTVTQKPTEAEINTFIGTSTNILVYYTGTDVSTDHPSYVFNVDNVGNVTQIFHEAKIYTAKSETYYENVGLLVDTISGMSISPLAAEYYVNFNTQFNTTLANITAQATIDLNVLKLALLAATPVSAMPALTHGQIITPGVYETAAAMTPTGTITLDGGGDPNAIFIFRTTAGALTFGAGCTLNLINGATSNNVFFTAFGAITLGASSSTSGTMLSDAVVTFGLGSFLNGRIFSTGGAINYNGGTISVPVLDSSALYPLGLTKNFAIFTISGTVTSTATGVIVGDIGTNSGLIVGFTTAGIAVTLSGTIYPAAQGASLVTVSIYIDNVLQTVSTRERTNSILKEDIVTSDIITVGEGQVVTAKVQNSIGISRFYNRSLILREIH